MVNNQFFCICAYYTYKVKIKYRSCYYCYTDFEGDAVFENDKNIETKIFSGFELLEEFGERLKNNDMCDFTINGNAYHFGMFNPTNGSFCDFDYIILKKWSDK